VGIVEEINAEFSRGCIDGRLNSNELTIQGSVAEAAKAH